MKKIINGKLYNTETATELGTWANAGTWRDFNHVEETLYRKRTGELFLFGEGGANTRYAERVDANSWRGGETIIPLTYQEAAEWAEKHLDADEYQEIFGPVSEDGDDESISARIPAALAAEARREAAKRGISMTAFLALCIREQLGKA